MLLELLLEGVFHALVDRNPDRTGTQWACLFLGVVLLLLAVGAAVSIGYLYGLAVAVVGGTLVAYGA
ncbi:hypothetical protein [Halopiger djelfimassiliensis]|uniref:hypothetical protein n=1 Tax=Halopiger djelfimassiliensis TaxID=1293047 RepID=UPI0006782CCE|nr:hypothetical protein [Halopiger djelfimassiliensis]